MRILFICTANICRSALAEVILRKKLQQRGLTDVEVASAGVHDFTGRARDPIMVEYASLAGYELTGEATYLSQEAMESADLIICMEQYHVYEVKKRLSYERWNRIRRFNGICFGEPTNLPDPTGDTLEMNIYALKRIEEGCDKLVSIRISSSE